MYIVNNKTFLKSLMINNRRKRILKLTNYLHYSICIYLKKSSDIFLYVMFSIYQVFFTRKNFRFSQNNEISKGMTQFRVPPLRSLCDLIPIQICGKIFCASVI